MAAKSSTLGTLHELFAQYWLDQMQRVDEETGRAVPLSAAEAAVLRAWGEEAGFIVEVVADDEELFILCFRKE